MNKVIFLIKQLIYDFIIATSFYIVNFWNSLRIKISNGPKSQISTGSRLPSKRSQKTRHLFITLSITIILTSHALFYNLLYCPSGSGIFCIDISMLNVSKETCVFFSVSRRNFCPQKLKLVFSYCALLRTIDFPFFWQIPCRSANKVCQKILQFTSTGDPHISCFQNSWSPLFCDSFFSLISWIPCYFVILKRSWYILHIKICSFWSQ